VPGKNFHREKNMNETSIQNDRRDETQTAIINSKPQNDAREKTAQPESRSRGDALASAATKRRERIRRLEARLERERSRENAASRKERNGQLFIWGAMVEGVYRDGNANEREQLRQWAKRMLTDHRHLQRAEIGFAHIEEDTTENPEA
jgi:hypothetical protein